MFCQYYNGPIYTQTEGVQNTHDVEKDVCETTKKNYTGLICKLVSSRWVTKINIYFSRLLNFWRHFLYLLKMYGVKLSDV